MVKASLTIHCYLLPEVWSLEGPVLSEPVEPLCLVQSNMSVLS